MHSDVSPEGAWSPISFLFSPEGESKLWIGPDLDVPPAHAYPENDSGRDETRNFEQRHASPALFSVRTKAAGHTSAEPKVWEHYSASFHLDLLAATGTLLWYFKAQALENAHLRRDFPRIDG